MKSNWLRVSMAMVAVLVVALAVSASCATDKKDTSKTAKQLPKLIDLGSTTCIPCKMMTSVLDQLKKDYKGQLDVQFVNVSKDQAAVKKYGISSIPTQIFLDAKGKEIYRHVGFIPEADIVKAFRDHGVKLKEPAKPKK